MYYSLLSISWIYFKLFFFIASNIIVDFQFQINASNLPENSSFFSKIFRMHRPIDVIASFIKEKQ